MVEFDATFIVQIINFLVLLTILNYLFYQPILKVISERQEALEGAEKATQSKLKEMATMQEAYQQQLDEARQKAHSLIKDQIQKAQQERESLLQRVEAETQQQLQNAREQIEKEAETVRTSLESEIDAVVTLVIETLIGEKATEKVAEKEKVKGAT